jgi:hypothetical protein
VLGYQEGHYRLVRDERTGQELAVPTIDRDTRLLTPQGKAAPAARPLPLDELRGEIRQHARAAGRQVN